MSGNAWDLTPAQRELRDLVANFMETEVRPAEAKLQHDAFSLPEPILAEIRSKARAAGLWCVATPAEYGGAGLGPFAQCLVAEEAAKCRMGAYVPAAGAFGWDPVNVIFHGGDELIDRFARPTIERGERSYMALSEPSGGADPGRSIRTTAVRGGDGWVLNGVKYWVSGADESSWGVIFARTGPGQGRTGITCFVVPTKTPGFETEPIPVIRSWYPCEVRLRDCEVPDEFRIGEVGGGFALAGAWLSHSRLAYAAGTVGIAQEALRIATNHAKSRLTFGKPLAQRQAIQWMLADSEIELRAARLLVWRGASAAELGRDFKVDASVAKVYATEVAGRVVDRCVQILGGAGVARRLPLERWYRELRIKRIGEGPSEVHRMVIARDLLGDAARETEGQ